MPKKKKSSGSSLRLSQKRHDSPLYNDVHVLGSETKNDFKRNKPFTVGAGEGRREKEWEEEEKREVEERKGGRQTLGW